MRRKKLCILAILLLLVLFAGTTVQTQAAVKNGWVTRQGKTYYYKNGKMYKGFLNLDGKTYYLNGKTGVMHTGWLKNKAGDRRYFSKQDGSMIKGEVKNNIGSRYFNQTNGYMYVGLVKHRKHLYYFDPKTGYRYDNGFKTVKGKSYYFKRARAQKGWMTINNHLYYFDKNCVMYKNRTATVDGRTYSFSSKGFATLVKNKWNKLLDKYETDPSVNQLIFVQYQGGTRAQVILYNKVNDIFKQIMRCQGYVGRNGINKVREGDAKTPTGTFGFTRAFGIKTNPGSKIKYQKLNPYLYWCGDKTWYNQMVDVRKKKHNCSGEHLINYTPHYNYALALDYNKEGIYKKGSAIFLHCTGSSPYTGGCIAVSEANMIKILQTVDKNAKICIYSA